MYNLISSRFKYNPTQPYHPSVSSEQSDLIHVVKSKLESQDYKLEYNQCPCGAKQQDILISEIDRYGLPLKSVLCLNCGTVRLNPYLDQASLSDFYTHIYRKMYGMDIQKGSYEQYFLSQRSYAQKIFSLSQNSLPPESWICEVGCGGGGAIKFFQEQGYQVAGCDYDVAAISFGTQKGVPNLFYGPLDSIGKKLPEVQFDLIYLHHVFEHLSDPVLFLKNCQAYLKPTGKILIIVPDISRIDQFGHPPAIGNLLMYLHIAHKFNFSLEGIQRIGQEAGYQVMPIKINSNLKTPWSKSPEMWLQLTKQTSVSPFHCAPLKPTGYRILQYLQKTEKLYTRGLCKGQIINKIKQLRSPQKILSKIQRSFSGIP